MFKIGCDPEVFVADAQGALRSIIGNLGGTKEAPMPLPIGDGFAVQEDNVAMEFNIPPAESKQQFIERVTQCREFLDTVIRDAHGWHIINSSAEIFPDAELDNPIAHIFGCDPDYNAWTGAKNPRPKSTNPNLRSCGGHVHVGYNFPSKDEAMGAMRGMDLFLGVPSVLMDSGDLRKQLYGKAGAFRFKSYGAEYRVLSNFWIFHPKLISWVYDNTSRVLEAVQAGALFKEYENEITSCINNNDKELAKKLVNDFNLEVVYA
ncbi:MAG TPA: hypothetical protein VFM18_02865 [Methanosarcina sp.]|nr:hypothetical protein [Methanosarcina sp.]